MSENFQSKRESDHEQEAETVINKSVAIYERRRKSKEDVFGLKWGRDEVLDSFKVDLSMYYKYRVNNLLNFWWRLFSVWDHIFLGKQELFERKCELIHGWTQKGIKAMELGSRISPLQKSCWELAHEPADLSLRTFWEPVKSGKLAGERKIHKIRPKCNTCIRKGGNKQLKQRLVDLN